MKVVERIHFFALKRFLNVSSRTPNVMVYGETGRYPLFVNIFVKSVKYWIRILKMPDDDDELMLNVLRCSRFQGFIELLAPGG